MGGRMEAGKRQGQPRRLTDSFIIVSGSLGEDCLVGRSWWGGGQVEYEGSPAFNLLRGRLQTCWSPNIY